MVLEAHLTQTTFLGPMPERAQDPILPGARCEVRWEDAGPE